MRLRPSLLAHRRCREGLGISKNVPVEWNGKPMLGPTTVLGIAAGRQGHLAAVWQQGVRSFPAPPSWCCCPLPRSAQTAPLKLPPTSGAARPARYSAAAERAPDRKNSGPGRPAGLAPRPPNRGPRCDPGPTCASSPTADPARSPRRRRSRSGRAGSLNKPMMLSLTAAPSRFPHVASPRCWQRIEWPDRSRAWLASTSMVRVIGYA